MRELTFGLSPVIRLGLRNPAKEKERGMHFKKNLTPMRGGGLQITGVESFPRSKRVVFSMVQIFI